MSATAGRRRKPRIGLYYPYIHFRDENWLKMAVLFWDGLTRIVPVHDTPHYSPAVLELQDLYQDFLNDHYPDKSTLEAVGYPFMQLINERRVELRERYGVRRSGNEIVRSDGVVSDRELLGDKLFKGLTDALVEAELAVLKTGRDGREEVYIDPKVADVYMAALAGEMAKRMKFLLVTNNPADHLAVSGLEVARLGEALLGFGVLRIARSGLRSAWRCSGSRWSCHGRSTACR